MTLEHGRYVGTQFLWTYADKVCKEAGKSWYRDHRCLEALQEVQRHYKPITHEVDWSFGIDEKTGTFPSNAYDI